MSTKSFLAAMIAAILVTACAHHQDNSPAFNRELGRQYQKLSVDGHNAYHWNNSKYFAAKAQQVFEGRNVPPESLESWSIPHEQRPALVNAYDRLQIALVPDGKRVSSPIHAARAQAAYDCWVEQSHLRMGGNTARTNCQAAFYHEFCAMYPGKCVKPQTLATMRDGMYRVHFASGQSKVDAAGRRTIADAVRLYASKGRQVVLAGHTDSTGSSEVNMRLSQQRVAAVRNLLIDNGVPAGNISESYFGDRQPLVGTANGRANAANRRVLIVVR